VSWLCLGCVLTAACAVNSHSNESSNARPATGADSPATSMLPELPEAAGAGVETAQGGVGGESGASEPPASTPANAGAAGEAPSASVPPMAAAAGSGGAEPPLVAAPEGCAPPPVGASDEEINALNTVNTLRAAAGATCLTLDLNIGKAARAHCAYYALNKDSAPECVISPHYEVAGCAGYTGSTPSERMRAAGFASGGGGGEVMAFMENPVRAVQTWVDSVWHRIPILDTATTVMGYGSAEGCDTIDFGPNRRREALSLVAYPYAGQIGVTTAFDGRNEGPMPPAPTTGWPSANPISLYGQQLLITEHQLFVDGDDTPLEHTWLDPTSPILPADQQSLLRNVVFMYANQPYLPNTTYRVKIVGTYAGGDLLREWTFTTGAPRRMRP
jgi:uncharacterized protein YkwD